jgi:hypothetical protein
VDARRVGVTGTTRPNSVNNFRLPSGGNHAIKKRATNSSHPNTGVEIFVPGLGLLYEQIPLWIGQSPLSVRRVFSFFSQGLPTP